MRLSNVEQAAEAVIDERESLKLDRQHSQALVIRTRAECV